MKVYIILMVLFSIGFFGVRHTFAEPARKHFGTGLYISFAAIAGAGFILHDAGLFVAVAGITILATVRDRVDAVCRVALLVALLPDIIYSAAASGHYVANIGVSDTLTVGALVASLFLHNRSRGPRWSAEEAIVFLLMLIFSVFQTRSYTITSLPRDLLTVVLGFGLPYLLFSRKIATREEFGLVVSGLAGAAMILSVVAVYEAVFHWSIYEAIWSNNSRGLFLTRNLRIRAGFLRTPTSFNESTSFAVFQLVGVFATVASRRLFRNTLFWVGAVLLTMVGLVAAQSRGADIGLLVGFFALALVRRQYAKTAAVAVGSAILVGGLLIAAPSMPKVAQFLVLEKSHNAESDYRQTLLRRGLEEGMKSPLFGDDKDRVMAHLSDIVQGEGIIDPVNTFLFIFLYSGLFGLGIFLILIMMIFMKTWRVRPQNKHDPSFLSLQGFIVSALAGELVALVFTSFWERNPYWLMIMFAGSKLLSVPKIARSATREYSQSNLVPRQDRVLVTDGA